MRPRRSPAPTLTLLGLLGLALTLTGLLRPGLWTGDRAAQASPFRWEDASGPVQPVMVQLPALEHAAAPVLPLEQEDLPLSPDQSGCQRGGRQLRADTEGFEAAIFPRPGGRFSTSDLFSRSPGFLDEIGWGAVNCEASVDSKSLWSVGGGSVGKTLKCAGASKDYPTAARGGKGIRTLLRYSSLDLTVSRGVGVRITFDYMAKMPEKALLVGIGDGNQREAAGQVSYTGYNYFQADTKNEWVRGEIVAYANGSEYLTPVANLPNKNRVELAFFYTDPPNADQPGATPGAGNPTPGMYGVLIDNLHIDILIDPRPCPPGSPTATEDPFAATPTPEIPEEPTETVRPTRTRRPTVVIPTQPPSGPSATPRGRKAFLPFLSRAFNLLVDWTPPPAGKTATRTPIPSATPPPPPTWTPVPTETEEPTETPVPTRTRPPTRVPTPTYTPRPSATFLPYGQVIIADAIPFTPGGSFEAIVLMNVGTGPQQLEGWFVQGMTNSRARCDLPAGLSLKSLDAYEIRSGRDAAPGKRMNEKFGEVEGMVCSRDFLWDNNQDQARLFDEDSLPMSSFCWDLQGPYACPN